MKKAFVSVNNRAPYETQCRSDIENLFEQMCRINNGFHDRPPVSFVVTDARTNKTVTVNWNYFDTVVRNATHDSITWTNEMVDLLLSDLA